MREKRQLLYITAHERIKEIIKERRLMPGDRLPSESELEAQLGVSRGTLRQALMLLRESGVIYNHQGKGTFLSPASPNDAGLERARHDLLRFAIVEIDRIELAVDYVVSSKSVQESLAHSEATLLARFQFLYYSKGEAVAYRTLFVPYKMLEERGVALESNDALRAFADDLLQNHFASAKTTIDAVEAREAVTQYMRAPKGAQMLCITEVSRDKTHTAVAYAKFYCYPEHFRFVVNRE